VPIIAFGIVFISSFERIFPSSSGNSCPVCESSAQVQLSKNRCFNDLPIVGFWSPACDVQRRGFPWLM
jgi:hypothetical protein